MKYCLIDEYNNLYSVDLKSPSQIIFWACVCLGVEYRGKTRDRRAGDGPGCGEEHKLSRICANCQTSWRECPLIWIGARKSQR